MNSGERSPTRSNGSPTTSDGAPRQAATRSANQPLRVQCDNGSTHAFAGLCDLRCRTFRGVVQTSPVSRCRESFIEAAVNAPLRKSSPSECRAQTPRPSHCISSIQTPVPSKSQGHRNPTANFDSSRPGVGTSLWIAKRGFGIPFQELTAESWT
jgi:hypothetical protein